MRLSLIPVSSTLVVLSLASLIAAGCGGGGGGAGGGGTGGSTANEEPCTIQGTFRACALPGDPLGTPSGGQQCTSIADSLVWSQCEAASTAASTPLLLSFDGAPIVLAASAGAFDLDGTMCVGTDWPSAATPWLALDRDGNGAIDDGSELFGSATVLASGARAPDGFAALTELDANGDGRITPQDPAWSRLRLWSDRDGDRVSRPDELSSLDARGVIAIDLRYTSEPRCDARGNCEIERAAFQWVDAAGAVHTGAIVDEHLRHR
jgi:hypothetical protein